MCVYAHTHTHIYDTHTQNKIGHGPDPERTHHGRGPVAVCAQSERSRGAVRGATGEQRLDSVAVVADVQSPD